MVEGAQLSLKRGVLVEVKNVMIILCDPMELLEPDILDMSWPEWEPLEEEELLLLCERVKSAIVAVVSGWGSGD